EITFPLFRDAKPAGAVEVRYENRGVRQFCTVVLVNQIEILELLSLNAPSSASLRGWEEFIGSRLDSLWCRWTGTLLPPRLISRRFSSL
ncbi:MAG: hypothetical protein ACU83O_06305, partial [Gammaproteobacteria bacterium]